MNDMKEALEWALAELQPAIEELEDRENPFRNRRSFWLNLARAKAILEGRDPDRDPGP